MFRRIKKRINKIRTDRLQEKTMTAQITIKKVDGKFERFFEDKKVK